MSTRDQHPEAQHDALTAAGCDEVYIDKASGKLARRPNLDKALLPAKRAGDQLVITKIDRLGRSLEHLSDLSTTLQDRGINLVALDQGIDTSTAVGTLSPSPRSPPSSASPDPPPTATWTRTALHGLRPLCQANPVRDSPVTQCRHRPSNTR